MVGGMSHAVAAEWRAPEPQTAGGGGGRRAHTHGTASPASSSPSFPPFSLTGASTEGAEDLLFVCPCAGGRMDVRVLERRRRVGCARARMECSV